VLVARNDAQLAEAAQDVRDIDAGIKVLTVPTDVSDETAVAALFDKVKSSFGTADVLVNNAGLSGAEEYIHAVDPKAWWKLMVCVFPASFSTIRFFVHLLPRAHLLFFFLPLLAVSLIFQLLESVKIGTKTIAKVSSAPLLQPFSGAGHAARVVFIHLVL
jgi:NAD(P)-dependent dehydrogenase (short-subunit alcohol dehydrogenase family)